MHGLKELQTAFKDYLLTGEQAIAGHVIGTGRVDGERRLAVYAGAYRARLLEALATDYPVLSTIMGEDAFVDLCHDYVDARPSRHYSLRWFGGEVSGFLLRQPRLRPWLAELAEFEWKLGEAFDAAHSPVLGEEAAARLAAKAWPALRLRLHPSVRELSLSWNVLSLWRSVNGKAERSRPTPLPEPGGCVIWRDGLTTRYRFLEQAEHDALRGAASGETFARLCERLALRDDARQALALRAAGFLKAWLRAGLVCEFVENAIETVTSRSAVAGTNGKR